MSATSLFRTVLIASLIFTVFTAGAGESFFGTLPPVLQNYLAQIEPEDMSNNKIALFIAGLLFVLMLSTPVGLWKFKSWARTSQVVFYILFILSVSSLPAVVMNSWEAMFAYTTLTLGGALIAMMFTGEVGQKFNAKKIKSNTQQIPPQKLILLPDK